MAAMKGVFIDHLSLHHIGLSVRGVLDGPSAWELRHLVESLLLPETGHVSINFRRCEEFKGVGLQFLFDFLSEMEDKGFLIELSGFTRTCLGPFRETAMGNIFEVRPEGSGFYSIFTMRRENRGTSADAILRRTKKA